MNILSDSLSAALIHSLWQDAIVGLLLWMVLAALRQRSANARYLVSCAAFAVMAAMPVATMAVLYVNALPAAGPPATAIAFATAVAGDSFPAIGTAPATIGIPDGPWISELQTWTLPAWVMGVLLFSIRLVSASAHTVALKRRTEPADEALTSMVSTLASRMDVTRPVRVLISTMTASPATVGWIRPVILLPPATMLGITPSQLEALIAHELAHVRRHDYAVNVLQMIGETLFFYHPAIWLVSRRIRVERELCCDDIAIDACGDAIGYAKALTQVAKVRWQPAGMAMGSSGDPLLRRIQRLLGTGSTRTTLSPLWIVATVLVMACAVMWTGTRAQSTQGSTGTMRGRVLDAATGLPIPDARLRADYVTGRESPTGTLCPIDDCTVGGTTFYRQDAGPDGRFEIAGVTPGDYFVMAAAPGYLQRRFGQTSNDMPEVTVRAIAGQTVPAVDIRLDRAGLVTGHIFSDSGDGLFGVEVELFRRQYVPGGARPMAVAFAQTEALGIYRFRDVTPGEYYVRAYVPESIRPTSADKSLAYTATFFPASTNLETAQTLTVASGQEVFGVDFPLVATKMRSVSGRLVDPTGVSLTTATVRLMPVGHGPVEMPKSPVTRDGQFRIVGVTPGDYTLLVFDSANSRSWNSAIQRISVRDDIKDLVLAAGPSVSVEGRVVRDDGTPLPFNLSDVRIALEQHLGQQMSFNSGIGRDIRADGTFTIRTGTGTNYLQVDGLPKRWNVKRATLDGSDVTDEPFDLRGGASHHLEIVLTDHVVRLTGNVTDRSGRSVANALVVVFPDDRSKWETSRLVRTTFSHQRGGYDLPNIPAANYRVVAVTALPRSAWTDPAVLDRLWPSSVSVSLEEGQRAVALKVVPPPTDLIQ